MTIEINGKQENISENLSLAMLVEAKGYELKKIAVELNGEIIPKSKYESCFLSEYDTLEVVTFVGGG